MNTKILVIDDNRGILHSYKNILSSSGDRMGGVDNMVNNAGDEGLLKPNFEVETAMQGKDGFKIANDAVDKGNPFAVAFVDMRIPPGWDGLKTAENIRKVDDNIFIVIVTAFSDKSVDELQQAIKHDVLFLRKPFVNEEIYQLARTLCLSWSQNQQLKAGKGGSPDVDKIIKGKDDEIERLQKIITELGGSFE